MMRVLLGDYAIFKIYASPEAPPALAPRTDVSLRELDLAPGCRPPLAPDLEHLRACAGEESAGFAAIENGVAVCSCWYWYGKRYRQRNFWPLRRSEAKLVEIATSEDSRGRGLASALIAFSTVNMQERGFTRLHARIWHSNQPSIRAFEKAGWRRRALVVEVALCGLGRRLRFVWPRRAENSRGSRPAGAAGSDRAPAE